MNVLQEFPDTESKLQRVAQSRKRRLEHHVNPNNIDTLSIDDEVDSEDRRTELFGLDAEKAVTTKTEDIENNRRFARIKKRPTYHNSRSTAMKASPVPNNSPQLRRKSQTRHIMEKLNIV